MLMKWGCMSGGFKKKDDVYFNIAEVIHKWIVNEKNLKD